MMDAAAAQATSKRRATELLAARELVKSSKQAAAVAEQRAEAARRAEVEAAAAFLAPRNDAESEAATLAAAAAAARSALAELESEAKRTCGEQADADPTEPNEDPRRWGISTYRTQEKWSATRRAVPITEDAEHVEMQRGETKGYMHHPRRGLVGAVQDWARVLHHRVFFRRWLTLTPGTLRSDVTFNVFFNFFWVKLDTSSTRTSTPRRAWCIAVGRVQRRCACGEAASSSAGGRLLH